MLSSFSMRRNTQCSTALVKNSSFDAVLNEGDIASTQLIELPLSDRGSIIPSELYQQRKHPDVRIARRATTIAVTGAGHQRERQVSKGLRRTLMIQARRLEILASQRYYELGGQVPIIAPGRAI